MALSGHQEIPERLYKHMKLVHAQSLLTNGEMRLGTLSDFSREEKHGAQIGDGEEGRYLWAVDHAAGSDLPPPFRAATAGALDGAQISNILVGPRSEDCHVLCLSLSDNPCITQKLGCTSVVEVSDFMKLAWVLALLLKGYYAQDCKVKVRSCQYLPLTQDVSEYQELDPVFVKPLKHEWQVEFRAAFCLVKSIAIEPLTLADPLIAACFRWA